MIDMSDEARKAFFEAVEMHERHYNHRKRYLRFAVPLINRFAKLHECPIGKAVQLVDEHRGARRISGGEKFVLYR